MIQLTSLDGEETWVSDLDLSALPKIEEYLLKLRQALNRLHRG